MNERSPRTARVAWLVAGELAERLTVSRQTVKAIETGRYDPSLPLAFRIAQVFHKPIEAIFSRGSDAHEPTQSVLEGAARRSPR